MSDRKQKPLSAEKRIILVFVISTIVSIVLVGAGLNYFLGRTALAQSRTHLESQAGMLARQCESEITEARLDLEFLARTPAFRKLSNADRIDVSLNGVPENVEVEKRQFLTGLINKVERFSVTYMLRPSGDIYLVEPFKVQPKLKARNLSERPYFQEAARTKAPVVSDSYSGADGLLAVAILIPILGDSNNVTGYLGGVFHLSRLSRLVSGEKIKPFDAGFIVDRKGNLIAHTDTALLREGPREHFAEHHSLVSRFLALAGGTSARQKAVLFGECRDTADAKPYLTALVPLSSGWGLGLTRDKAAVEAEVRPITWGITALAGLLLALIGGFGVIIAHTIGRRWDNAERALRDSESKYRELFNNSEVGMYRSKLDGSKILASNNKLCQIFGCTEEEMLTDPAIMRWADAGARDRMVEALRKTGSLQNYEIDILTKSGGTRTCSVSIKLYPDQGYLEGSAIDITERRMAEESLKENEEKYRSMIVNLSEGFYSVTLDGALLDHNREFNRILGFDPDKSLVGIQLPDFWQHPDARTTYLDEFKKHGSVKSYPIAAKKTNGELVFVEVNSRLVKGKNNQPAHIEGSFIDVTERKRAEEALERVRADLARSNKELEQFAYIASHDLQEPLRMVSSYTQLLAQKYEGQLDDKAKKYIAYAVDGAIRMQRLINDLLTYSRISTKGRQSELTDSHSVLGEALHNLAAAIEESCAIIVNEELPTVLADASQLLQVFQNLIANAIKFHGEDTPRVQVSAQDRGHEWIFSVKDNGIGIDPRYADRLFVIFQRLHTKEEYPGTGIGLAVCKRIVERHGGRIWFESELGKGTTFFFTIPKQERMAV